MRTTLAILLLLTACGDEPAPAPEATDVAEHDRGRFERNLPRPGDPLPSLTGVTLDGDDVRLETIAGRTALLIHWTLH